MQRIALVVSAIILVYLQASFLVAYMGHERAFFFWDHAMYHNLAWNAWQAFQSGIATGWAHFQNSMTQDYNDLFALPSLISFSLFGVTRSVFILTNFAVFFLAYEAAIAFILRRLFSLGWPAALVASLILCSLVPPLWLPLLEGYPDIGAAAALMFAFGLSLGPLNNKRSAALLGFLLAISFLLRRHYAYPAAALLTAKGFIDFVSLHASRGHSYKSALWSYVIKYGVCVAALLTTIAAIAPKIIPIVLVTDYAALYKSYEKPALEYLSFTLARFGAVLLVASMGGLIAAYLFMPKLRGHIRFLALFVSIALLVWCAGPSQAGHHYMLHALPLFCVVGLASLFAVLVKIQKAHYRKAAIGIVSALLVSNSVWALWLSPRSPGQENNHSIGLFSASGSPIVRKDIDQLMSLASNLANSAKADDRIYAIGSSFIFNQDLVRAVYTDGMQQFGPVSRMVFGPEIDSRNISPLHAFAQASIFIVPDPPQYHLAPEAQKTITALTQPFLTATPPNKLFRADKEVYALDSGVKLRVWRRDPWTPEILHNMLATIRKEAPVANPDWVVLTHHRDISVTPSPDKTTNVVAQVMPKQINLTLFYDVPLTSGDYVLRFSFDRNPSCAHTDFRLDLMNKEGKNLFNKTFLPITSPGIVATTFNVPSERGAEAFIQLTINSVQEEPCVFALQRLTVEPEQGSPHPKKNGQAS